MNDLLTTTITARGGLERWNQLNGVSARLIQGGVRQLGEMLAKDPILRATEEALNANPLRQVVPVDWAEIVRALRTVWLRSISRPDKAIAADVDRQIGTASGVSARDGAA